jgi:acetolactate synthase small subunit
MPTFVVHARRSPETLGRLLSLFHRRVLDIEQLTAERAQDPAVWRITITVEVDADLARRIEANLYKLEDVLLVERSESGQELIGEKNPGDVNL